MFSSQYLYNGYYTFQPIFPCSFFVSLCEHLEFEGLLSSYLNVFLTMYVKIMFPMAYINVCMAYMLHIPTSSIKALIMMSVILKSTGNQKIKANVNSINRYMPPIPTR